MGGSAQTDPAGGYVSQIHQLPREKLACFFPLHLPGHQVFLTPPTSSKPLLVYSLLSLDVHPLDVGWASAAGWGGWHDPEEHF